jgi:uncharacterized protein (TIGR02444 family)
MDFPKSAFWDFTLQVYGREGVSPAVIALQDTHRLDVDILLFCCWTGSTGRGPLGAAAIARAKTVADPWQAEVVNALRTIRRRIKDGFEGAPAGLPDALRKQILTQEIDAERLEQIMLEATVTAAPDPSRPISRLAASAPGRATSPISRRSLAPPLPSSGRSGLRPCAARLFGADARSC